MGRRSRFFRNRGRIDTWHRGVRDAGAVLAMISPPFATLALSGRRRYISADSPEISRRLRRETVLVSINRIRGGEPDLVRRQAAEDKP
jgi:hypothetical protein